MDSTILDPDLPDDEGQKILLKLYDRIPTISDQGYIRSCSYPLSYARDAFRTISVESLDIL